MKWHLQNLFPIFRESIFDFANNKSFRMSAALAYYTVFSIAPMLIVIINLLNFFYGGNTIEGTIFQHIQDFIGADAALQIRQVISNAAISKDANWASVIGICALVLRPQVYLLKYRTPLISSGD